MVSGKRWRWLLLGLATLDGILTLYALEQGAVEANPLMAGLTHRPGLFLSVKVSLSYLGGQALALRAPKLLPWACVPYTLVCLWTGSWLAYAVFSGYGV